MESNPGSPSSEPVVRATSPTRPPVKPRTFFDVMFGIALPVVCLLLDPGVLRGGTGLLPSPLHGYAMAAYTAIAPAMLLLAAWLGWKRGALLLSGPLFVGGLVALAIGIALLPISLIASLMLIGLLGLVPFGTALAFFRNGIRAFRAACAGRSRWVVGAVALALGAVSAAIPVAAQRFLNGKTQAALDAAHSGDPKHEAEAIAGLKPLGWLADQNRFVDASLAAKDPAVQERLARIWQAVTGEYLQTNPD